MLITELYPMYYQEITRFALSLTRSRPCAEDVAQETFLRALKSSHVLLNLDEFKARAWLYTTAKNIVTDGQRRVLRAPPLDVQISHFDDLSRVSVESLMGVLTPEEKRLFALRHHSGMNSTEIGVMLGLPPATVRTRLRAAVKKLREAYLESER